jgi:hypothetical protein
MSRAYTIDTLVAEVVGRYIQSNTGSLQLSNLINGGTYKKCWQAFTQWVCNQHENGNAVSIPPIGMLCRARSAPNKKFNPNSRATEEEDNEPLFLFFREFVDAAKISVRNPDHVTNDDASAVRANPASLAKMAGVDAPTCKTATAHLFRR